MFLKVQKESVLFDFLFDKVGTASKTKISKMIKHGQILVNSVVQFKQDFLLKEGDSIEIRKDGVNRKVSDLEVVYEDRDIIVVEKPAGLLCISTEKQDEETLFKMVSEHIKMANKKNRIFIVHRLDRDVSGLIIFAKSEKVKEILQTNWKNFEKRYVALVEGTPKEDSGTIETYLAENRAMVVYVCDSSDKNARKAVTKYSVIKKYGNCSLLSVKIDTGRKNQIRVHLSHIGNPIVGDKKYGASTNLIGRLALHSIFLSIEHPVTRKQMIFEGKIPPLFLR